MTLAAFKKIIESAKVNGQFLKSEAVNANGEVMRTNDFAPVTHTQSNSFALLRNNQLSWVEYGKASEWEFKDSKAIKSMLQGCKLVFEFNNPSFFGF